MELVFLVLCAFGVMFMLVGINLPLMVRAAEAAECAERAAESANNPVDQSPVAVIGADGVPICPYGTWQADPVGWSMAGWVGARPAGMNYSDYVRDVAGLPITPEQAHSLAVYQ